MATSWAKKSAALHTVGRKLEDGAMYIIDLEDMCPAGVLVQAYKQETSDRYTLSVSEGEVRSERACLFLLASSRAVSNSAATAEQTITPLNIYIK